MSDCRKSTVFLGFIFTAFLMLGSLLVHANFAERHAADCLARKRALVKALEITDLCMFTDARYTRHPSMADLNTPFQDYPGSFEHFPSGTILTPPPHLRSK